MIITVLGKVRTPMNRFDVEFEDWPSYYKSVCDDYAVVKRIYPFSYLSNYPTTKPTCLSIVVVAVDIGLITSLNATENDFLGKYTRKIYVEVPYNYKTLGCKIYGAKWIDPKLIPEQQMHIYMHEMRESYGYEFCVGTPESFQYFPNVILENIRTAERMLIAYEELMTCKTQTVNLLAYSHGKKGRLEFLNNKSKYIPKGAKYAKSKP